ncbi:APC family permease [Nonomuraea sp. NPDC049152]|uniref:APC family permease n=1 Tax=Nonomuraea sp. NPDC049152 TaxID=3154350 RepID=UPI0033CB7755
MTITDRPPRPRPAARGLANDRLGIPAVLYFVISATAALTVVAGGVPAAYAITGVAGLPLAFLLLGAVLALFSFGYLAMARRVKNAGAFYAFVAHGLGKPLGVGAAWMTLFAYNGLQIGLYGLVGAATSPLVAELSGVTVPWWAVALVAWAVVAVLGMLRVDVNSRVLAVLLLGELTVVLLFNAANLLNPASGGLDLAPLAPQQLFVPGVGALFVFAIASFAGFESSAVFTEESKNPARTIPVATFLALAILSGLYALSAWSTAVSTGTGQVVARSQGESSALFFNLLGANAGAAAASIAYIVWSTSVIASLIAFHNAIARYVFALGRERALPAVFARTSRHSGAPVAGSLAQSGAALVVIVLWAVAGLDPVRQLFVAVGSFGGFGTLTLLVVTSVAVIVYFARRPGIENLWRRLIAPGLAACGLGAVLAFGLGNFDTVLAVGPGSPWRWILPAIYPLAAVAGVIWALRVRAVRPGVYAGIGLGADREP